MAKISKTVVLLLGSALVAGGWVPSPSSPCDVNQDSNINVVDVETVISEALGSRPAVHDLNGDGYVDVVDVQMETVAALGLICLAGGSQTHAIGGVPFSVENSVSPVPAGPMTLAFNGAPFSLENSISPVVSGTQTVMAAGFPFSVLNSASPAPAGSQTYYASGLYFSIFNGPSPPSFPAPLPTASLRFLIPVNPTFLAEALARAAQNVSGNPVCRDSDGDGICDADELIIGTSPYLADTDGDGYPDGLELALGSDPLDPKSVPNIRPPGYFVTTPVSIQNFIPVAGLTPRRQGAIHALEYR